MHRKTIVVSSSAKRMTENRHSIANLSPGKILFSCRDLKPSQLLSDDNFIVVGRDKIINTHCKISF
jgi:hypothetical protein